MRALHIVALAAILLVCPAAAADKSAYSQVLDLSLQFYEAQRAGKLPSSTIDRVPWRADSFTDDCVPGGYFDAGDHLKLFFPMANSLAFIGLGIVEFPGAYSSAGQLANAKDALRWGTDALMAAHVSPNEFIGQVGDPGPDHAFWGRPEEYKGSRPCYKWNLASQPASDLASAAASALATCAIVFRDSDSAYPDRCLKHAKELYAAATANEGKYSSSYAEATYVYNSYTFRDDVALAAAMLWKATGDGTYLEATKDQRAKSDFAKESYVSWDATGPLSAILLKCGGESTAEADAHIAKFASDWQDCSSNGFKRTPGGLCLAPLGGWGNLRYATTAAFASVLYANCETDAAKRAAAIKFAKTQVDYALGSSGRSFVVGYGTNPPLRPHHRAASCPSKPAPCGWDQFNTADPNPQVIKGALVGGPPGPSDEYADDREDYQQNEVAIDFNAGFTSALAGLIALQ